MTKLKKKYITREEERNLILIYQNNINSKNEIDRKKADDALEILLEAHTAYVQKIASKQYQKFGKIVEYDDLIQEGKIGLIKAIRKFQLGRESINPNNNQIVKNQALLTYAHNYILSEMQTLFHRSNATHIPAHTIRAIHFEVTNPGCNTEERKALAKKAMRAESLSNFDSTNPETEKQFHLPSDLINIDPTGNDSIKQIYSNTAIKAIELLTPLEWKIIQMKFGLINGEEGVIAKSSFIAETLNLPVDKVEKIFKRGKRILFNNLKRKTASH